MNNVQQTERASNFAHFSLNGRISRALQNCIQKILFVRNRTYGKLQSTKHCSQPSQQVWTGEVHDCGLQNKNLPHFVDTGFSIIMPGNGFLEGRVQVLHTLVPSKNLMALSQARQDTMQTEVLRGSAPDSVVNLPGCTKLIEHNSITHS